MKTRTTQNPETKQKQKEKTQEETQIQKTKHINTTHT